MLAKIPNEGKELGMCEEGAPISPDGNADETGILTLPEGHWCLVENLSSPMG